MSIAGYAKGSEIWNRLAEDIRPGAILSAMKHAVQVISIVKPTRCTNVSNLFYFGMTLYMFRTVYQSIIRSSRLYIQQQAYVKKILMSSGQQYLFHICLLPYVQSWTPGDGWRYHPKHVQCHSKINKFDTLVHLVGFTIGIILRCTALWMSNQAPYVVYSPQ